MSDINKGIGFGDRFLHDGTAPVKVPQGFYVSKKETVKDAIVAQFSDEMMYRYLIGKLSQGFHDRVMQTAVDEMKQVVDTMPDIWEFSQRGNSAVDHVDIGTDWRRRLQAVVDKFPELVTPIVDLKPSQIPLPMRPVALTIPPEDVVTVPSQIPMRPRLETLSPEFVVRVDPTMPPGAPAVPHDSFVIDDPDAWQSK